ncbi:nuclease [Corticibacter populi]|uniref:Nuclease n=1 Tax=Corticibacter populi TaxID=1550736 RepID=A0A3M6QYT5_9BURK|nr:NERD domain-containing protein [Corticibacter populi]RMX08186.1 nuclease [Corticibacter populi]RZS35452.1 topoisomerase-like DNA binding C4 zinc finger protein [Corticibacter populi]
MNMTPVLEPLFQYLWWTFALAVVVGILRLPIVKGMVGEGWVRLIARLRLPKETYHCIHNVTLPTIDGSTQIDHIFVSRFGIFVVETKHMKGWIYGRERDAQWTQKIYRNSFRFQNPLRQNYKHLMALQAALNLPDDVCHSLVVFTGDCTFKTDMPANVTQNAGYVDYIRQFQEPVLTEDQVEHARAMIEAGRLTPNWATHRQHVMNLKAKAAAENAPSQGGEPKCPRCDGAMVLRQRRNAPAGESRFWGCVAFPKCRGVRAYSGD